MFERIKATLRAYRVEYDVFFNEAALHEGTPERDRAGDRAAVRGGPPLPLRGRAVAAHDRLRRRQGPRRRALDRPDDVLRGRRRLRRAQARARLRPARAAAGLRPPRLRGADEGEHGGARRRPRPPRDPDPAVRAHRRGRRARVDVQAPRRVHHPRRAHRRDRRRRHALLHALALATTRRSTSTSTSRAASRRRTPSTTSSTRTRGSRRCGARRGRSGSPRALAATGLDVDAAPLRARAGQEAARLPRGGRGGRRAARAAPDRRLRARPRAGLHRLLPRLPGRRRRARLRSRTGACACRSSPSGRSPALSTCSGSRRPTRCDRV